MQTGSNIYGPKANQFRKVPCEIVEAICRFLIDSDRLCFALTCKALYITCTEDRNHTRGSISKLQKVDFLLRLQNENWRYCTECEVPHWCSAWQNLKYHFRFSQKICHSSYKLWHRPPFKGKVDLCPCSSMTFYKHQLFTYLCRNPKLQYQRVQQYIRSDPFMADIGCDESFVNFTHECTFSNHPFVEVTTRTTIWFDEMSKTLQLLNHFQFDTSKAGSQNLGPLGRTSSNSCVHKDTKRWIEDFFRLSKSKFHVQTQKNSCCQRLSWNNPQKFEIYLHRNLGGSRWPNKRWKSHCHD